MSRMQASNINNESAEHQLHKVSQDGEQQMEGAYVHWVGRGSAAGRGSRGKRRSRGSGSQGRGGAGGDYAALADHSRWRDQTQPASAPATGLSPVMRHSGAGLPAVTPRYSGCSKCGTVHKKYQCPAYGLRCNKSNHYARMCRTQECYTVQEDPSDQKFRNDPIDKNSRTPRTENEIDDSGNASLGAGV